MPEKPSQFSERRRSMSAVTEASELIQSLAGPGRAGESVKGAIQRAARAAGVSAGLAKRLWYSEVRRIDADLMDKLRDAANARTEKDGHRAYSTLLARLEACEAALRLSDQNTHRHGDHGHRRVAGAHDRALDQGR